MAVDEVLLLSAAEAGICTLRFYGWKEPTLSLGYFQGAGDRVQHPGSRHLNAVRRATGGGAIVHDAELTYSLALPDLNHVRRDSTWLYAAVHGALISTLEPWHISARQCSPPTAAATQPDPFLCFERRTKGDVLAGGAKICGSAQRRRWGGILQHGSLLLSKSSAAEELLGLADVVDAAPPRDALLRAWSQEIAARVDVDLSASELSRDERGLAESLASGKYGTAAWTYRR